MCKPDSSSRNRIANTAPCAWGTGMAPWRGASGSGGVAASAPPDAVSLPVWLSVLGMTGSRTLKAIAVARAATAYGWR